MIQVDMKKIMRYGLVMVVGMTVMVYGMIDIAVETYGPRPMSDAEIIQRAKDLGMVDIKEAWMETTETDKNAD
jgi:hypothetical protein